jgi:hypothetical protein
MYVTPSAPSSVGGVIDDAIRLYRHSFGRCWLLAFLPGLTAGASQLLMLHYLPTSGVLSQVQTAQALAKHPLPGMVFVYLAVFGLIGLSFQGAVAARQAAVARNDDSFTLGRALGTAFTRLPIFILSVILLYLALIGTVVATVIALIPVGIVLRQLHLMLRALVGAGLTVTMLVTMLSVMGRLQLFMVAIYIDRNGPVAALKTSWRLTRGHWWRALAIMTVAIIMLGILFVATSLLTNVEGYLTHFGAIHRYVLAPLLAIVTCTLLYPLAAAVWVSMYNDFKLRREGGDLAARVGALENA